MKRLSLLVLFLLVSAASAQQQIQGPFLRGLAGAQNVECDWGLGHYGETILIAAGEVLCNDQAGVVAKIEWKKFNEPNSAYRYHSGKWIMCDPNNYVPFVLLKDDVSYPISPWPPTGTKLQVRVVVTSVTNPSKFAARYFTMFVP